MSAQGLSCYTANLHAYLDAEWDAARVLASSIRLAVRLEPDRIAFSHHEPSLDRLPDGTRLRYAGAESAAAALGGVAAELERHGRALVVVDAARLPWSAGHGDRPTPHWLLVDDRRADEWRVVDDFSALMPDGCEQRPYRGWVRTGSLRAAMTLPASWTPQQDDRNALAFGARVAVPDGAALWLERRRDDAPAGDDADTGAGWAVGDAEVLPLLAHRLSARHAETVAHLDDLWAAAGHRCFAYRWRLAGEHDERVRQTLLFGLSQWERLPRMLRIAAESVAHGRPRPALVRAALEALLPPQDRRP